MNVSEEMTTKNHWQFKFAPFRTSWTEIIQHGKFTLRGVRSPAARKHLPAYAPEASAAQQRDFLTHLQTD